MLYQYWRSATQYRNLRTEETYFTRNLINQYTKVEPNNSLSYPIPIGGILDLFNTSGTSHNVRGQVNYAKKWNLHEVNALTGFEVKDLNSSTSTYRYYGYNDDLATHQVVDYINFFAQYYNPATVLRIPNIDNQSAYTDRFLSYYANTAYTFSSRYTLSASARKDQSNLFGVRANQRGVPLWSAGIAWNLSEEPFYKFEKLPYLKLRTTYGYNGNINKNVTAYTTAAMVGFNNLTGLPYATVINPPNPELQWERVKVLNLGLDFETANNVLTGTLEFYSKWGLDLIGTIPYPPSTGITTFTGNTANTKGHGWDLILNSSNLNRAFKWNTNFLFSYLHEIVSRYKVKSAASAYLTGASGVSIVSVYPLEGKPLYALYSYPWAGLDPETGNPQAYLDGQPSSDYAAIISNATPENIVFHGPARPKYFGAVRNTFSWKNISLSFNIAYRMGYFFRRNSVRYNHVWSGQLAHGDYALRWQNPGDESHTIVPSMPNAPNASRDNVFIYSSALVEKGDHIRLQDVSINYTLNKSNLGNLPVNRVQLYTYLNNLGIIWKATKTHLDPDFPKLKPVRSIALGLKIDF